MTIAITVAVAFGVVLWDYCVQLPDEIALYRTKDKAIWRAPATWFFVILRYSGLLATFPALFFTSLQSGHCQFAASISQAGAVLVVISSGAIFCYRVFAIWSGNNIVKGIVGIFYLIMVASWIAAATQFRAINGPPTPYLSNCQPLPIVAWAPISYSSSVAFDTIVLIFTLFKLHGNLATTKSKVGKQIYRDNLGYFLLTTVTNITVLSIQALGPQHALLKPTAVPFSTLMTVTMGSRVFLNLKLFDKKQRRDDANVLPLSGSSGSGSHPSHHRFLSASQNNPFAENANVIDVRGPFTEEPKYSSSKA